MKKLPKTSIRITQRLLRNDMLRAIAGLILLVLLPLVLGRRLELMVLSDADSLYAFSMKWNLALMFGFEVILLLLTQSPKITIRLAGSILTILYTVDYFVCTFRGSSLRLNDLTATGTAVRVLKNYTLKPSKEVVIAWLILVIFWGLSSFVGLEFTRKLNWKWNLARYSVSIVIASAITVVGVQVFCFTNFWEQHSFYVNTGMASQLMYEYNGFLVGSCLDIKYSRVTPPEGYTSQTATDILLKYESQVVSDETEEKPHVILIMNESFSDLRVLGDLQLSENNIPFYDSLDGNIIKGYTYSSVYGGGTANAEFEALTGFSCGFLPTNYYPYQQCMINRTVPSVVSMMEAAGYTTYAMHPATERNWNRGKIYQNLGFDHVLWEEDFQTTEKVHYGVSDLDTYRKVEELFENRENEERMFIFDLTIQNHGGYTDTNVEQTIHATNVENEELDNYLSLMKKSDEALEQLIHYFEEQNEKVVICLFGDHQPVFADAGFYDQICTGEESVKFLNLRKFKTPFMIWSNYEISFPEEASKGKELEEVQSIDKKSDSEDFNRAQDAELEISMNYLGEYLLHYLGIPTTPYFEFLRELRKTYPVITTYGYVDQNGVYSLWSPARTEFPEYRYIQYKYLFD